MLDEVYRLIGLASHEVMRDGLQYWLRKQHQSGRPLPGRQHLDPGEMKPFLPYVVLFDVIRNGVHYRFRHRLTGTHFAEIFGRDVTGMFIEHAGSLETFDEVYGRFSRIVDDKVAVLGVAPSPVREKGFLQYEHLTLPLASDGETVDMLFGIRCILPGHLLDAELGYECAKLLDFV